MDRKELEVVYPAICGQ
ncbi:Protein of unknown function [Bacillus mycoides]|uniref:Uncharacterized protein n=1 Tax=Bacillus mycoides TaxID=1405 RepID=A0A1G4EI12_BACMY|nr:Protein of unknown function [Bacillus mycoides]